MKRLHGPPCENHPDREAPYIGHLTTDTNLPHFWCPECFERVQKSGKLEPHWMQIGAICGS